MMNNRDNLISIIVPCYNEEHAIPYFYKAITEHSTLMKNEFGVDFEYLFINDGSVDNTLTVLKEYANKDNRVKYISFSRNFGKESAMYAGLKMRPAIILQLWTRTYRILRICLRRCTKP